MLFRTKSACTIVISPVHLCLHVYFWILCFIIIAFNSMCRPRLQFYCMGVIYSNPAGTARSGRNPFKPCPEPHESSWPGFIINSILLLVLSSSSSTSSLSSSSFGSRSSLIGVENRVLLDFRGSNPGKGKRFSQNVQTICKWLGPQSKSRLGNQEDDRKTGFWHG